MTSCPSLDELHSLRKGLRKKKPLSIHDGLQAGYPGIGGFIVRGIENDFEIEWEPCDGERKTSRFQMLCMEPSEELNRLELEWLAGKIFDRHAHDIAASIGHPIEAIRASASTRANGTTWRHWGLVPTGHMLGFDNRNRN